MLWLATWTSKALVARADKLCAAAHFLAWFTVATTWIVNWRQNGPSPSGPLFNFAYRFIGRIDYLVMAIIEDLTMKVGQTAASWFLLDLGASFTVVCACLLLIGGTLQWFLLGKLAQWVAATKGINAGFAVLGAYAMWISTSAFLWIAA
jgi:hypothetical protein